ncbi:MAG: hypothetical protein RR994_02660, partial [Clostridia bacterium]
MKTSYRILAWLFTAFLAVGLIVNTILPDKGYSDSEKRELGALPKFTASSALAGDFTREFDTYVSDQFFARDMWVSIKGMSQYLSGMKLLND